MTLDEQSDWLEGYLKTLPTVPEELSRIAKTLRFLAKPNIQAAIREEHQAEQALKRAAEGGLEVERMK